MKTIPSILLGAISCAAFATAALAVQPVQAAQTTLFSEDFSSVANGTSVNGLTPAVGQPFAVSVDNTAPNTLQVNNGAVDTTGGRRVVDAPFTGALGAGQTLDVTVGFLAAPNGNFFSGGFAGFRLMAGGTPVAFFGDSNDDSTGYDLAATSNGGAGEIKSGNATLPATVLLTYAYDTGVTTLSENGTQIATTTLAPGQAVNDLQFENNNGGDAKFNSISATAVPEPSTWLAAGGLLLLAAGDFRRRLKA